MNTSGNTALEKHCLDPIKDFWDTPSTFFDHQGLSVSALDATEPYDVSSWISTRTPIAGRYPKLELINESKKYILKLGHF